MRTNVTVKLRVQDTYLDCGTLQYLEDPRFTGYRVDPEVDTELEVKILVGGSSCMWAVPPPLDWKRAHFCLWVSPCTPVSSTLALFSTERK